MQLQPKGRTPKCLEGYPDIGAREYCDLQLLGEAALSADSIRLDVTVPGGPSSRKCRPVDICCDEIARYHEIARFDEIAKADGLLDQFYLWSVPGSLKSIYECIKAVSETDFTDMCLVELKRVPIGQTLPRKWDGVLSLRS